MILPVMQIHLPLIEEGVFFVGPLVKDGKKKYVYKSPLMHAYTGNGNKKYTNAKSVSLKNIKKGKLTLKKGKTFKIKAKVKKVKKNKKLFPKNHPNTVDSVESLEKLYHL